MDRKTSSVGKDGKGWEGRIVKEFLEKEKSSVAEWFSGSWLAMAGIGQMDIGKTRKGE